MSVATKAEPLITPVATEHRVLLSGVSWETYERLVDELERAGRRLKLTYDDGWLEIEMPSEVHELLKGFVSQLLELVLIDMSIRFLPVGATTYKREMMRKGLEADESYYVTRVSEVSQKGDNDISRDPPPDLAIEVEVTVPLLDKLPVYAAIGVPEIWHIDENGKVRLLHLHKHGEYAEQDASAAVPHFTVKLITQWIDRRLKGDHLETLQAFRKSLHN